MSAEECFEMGIECYNEKRYESAAESLVIAARNGYMEAKKILLKIMTSDNPPEAFKSFIEGADQGHAGAQYKCGKACCGGRPFLFPSIEKRTKP